MNHHSRIERTERINELRGFAARLEENIFNSADHQVIHCLLLHMLCCCVFKQFMKFEIHVYLHDFGI